VSRKLDPLLTGATTFEHGFLIGKLTRQRVIAVVKGDIETPNDISGVVYVKLDANNNWQKEIKREMRQAGYRV
jgi:predicted nucleotide-binding protein